MTMHIDLSPEMETFTKGKVAGGYYGNATEVIRDAIRQMRAEEIRLQVWTAALKKGDDELVAGESVPYGAATLEESTRSAEAVSTNAADNAAEPDALP